MRKEVTKRIEILKKICEENDGYIPSNTELARLFETDIPSVTYFLSYYRGRLFTYETQPGSRTNSRKVTFLPIESVKKKTTESKGRGRKPKELSRKFEFSRSISEVISILDSLNDKELAKAILKSALNYYEAVEKKGL